MVLVAKIEMAKHYFVLMMIKNTPELYVILKNTGMLVADVAVHKSNFCSFKTARYKLLCFSLYGSLKNLSEMQFQMLTMCAILCCDKLQVSFTRI